MDEWVSGTTALKLRPIPRIYPNRQELTWRLWRLVLTGFRKFVEHYPGVYPACRIFYVDRYAHAEGIIGEADLYEVDETS